MPSLVGSEMCIRDSSNTQQYQELVGSLIYLSTCTRWDIAYSVMQLTRVMSSSKDEHMVAAKRVLRHLKGTPDLCVRYSKDSTLHGYSDASQSDDPNNSRSVSGSLYMFAGGSVTWSSKKQPVVAISSCESECIALAYAGPEAVYLSDLLSELTFPQFSSVQMYENHQVLQNSRPGRTYLYEIPFSPRAGCIEYNNRIS